MWVYLSLMILDGEQIQGDEEGYCWYDPPYTNWGTILTIIHAWAIQGMGLVFQVSDVSIQVAHEE